MALVIRTVRPKAFLFENVEGLLVSRWTADGHPGEIFKDVLRTFQSIEGYQVKYSLVRSREYGVPQNRPRVLLVGVRNDVFEGENGIDAVAGGFLPRGSRKYPHLSDVLSDLVDQHFEYGGRTEKYPKKAESDFQERMRRDNQDPSLLHDHEYSNHSKSVINRFSFMIKTQGDIHYTQRTKKFNQRLLPKRWSDEGPNITITSLPDDFVHFEQPRSLTVRECARIQTFPDWYKFVGPRTVGGLRRAGNPLENDHKRTVSKYSQIGNAVPVDLGQAIGAHLASIIRG
jgi:DNA (cytosine-5)-methyltransferase 1